MAVNQTAQKILNIAQKNVQTRGFNGFSYRDLAKEIGIKTSSIHYYFPTKDDLALSLVTAFRGSFNCKLQRITTTEPDLRSQLSEYTKLFENNLAADNNKFCLCGMLASEVNSLSERVTQEIQAFFDDNERWLAAVITQGQNDHSFNREGSPDLIAAQLLATIEGAMLIVRSQPAERVVKFRRIVSSTIDNLLAPSYSK